MSRLNRGNYTLEVVDSTRQFTLVGNGYLSGRAGADTQTVEAATDMIALLKAYIALVEVQP